MRLRSSRISRRAQRPLGRQAGTVTGHIEFRAEGEEERAWLANGKRATW